MNNKGKKGKTGKKSPRPSHSGRPVSVKKTSSEPAANSVKKKKRKTKIYKSYIKSCPDKAYYKADCGKKAQHETFTAIIPFLYRTWKAAEVAPCHSKTG